MTGDSALIQIVDAAMAEAARKSGAWLVCRLGCTQCCLGPFAINPLDVRRLQQGLAELETRDPDRAEQVRERARRSLARLADGFPGDPETGILDDSEEAEARFADFAGDEPCPSLDPETGGCDLYSSRPMTCRTFGPPVRCGPEAVGVCELCYQGATGEQIAACEVEVDPDGVEAGLLDQLERATGAAGQTIVAYALR
jgi:Fe-S-cluster containining protein